MTGSYSYGQGQGSWEPDGLIERKASQKPGIIFGGIVIAGITP